MSIHRTRWTLFSHNWPYFTNENVNIFAQVTQDVLREFAEDNLKYLELRTTPRDVPATGMTRRSYIQAVLRAIDDYHQGEQDMQVRLLLAVDRGRHSVDDGMEIVALADDLKQQTGGVVVGVDLSGDPSVCQHSLIYLFYWLN